MYRAESSGTYLKCRTGRLLPCTGVLARDPEMVYPRISGDKVIPRLSGVLKILKVMDHAYGAYVLQSEVRVRDGGACVSQ